jgi:hypothetical protein
VCLELVLVLVPLVLLLVNPVTAVASPLVLGLGVPVDWLMVIKLLAYLTFLLLLVGSVNVRAFLDSRHAPSASGHLLTTKEVSPQPSSGVTLTEQQAALFQTLASTFQAVGLLVVLAGAGLMVWETTMGLVPNPLTLLESLVLLIVGVMMMLPPGSLNLAAMSEAGSVDLAQVFRRLGWLCAGVLVGGLIILAVALVNLQPLYYPNRKETHVGRVSKPVQTVLQSRPTDSSIPADPSCFYASCCSLPSA